MVAALRIGVSGVVRPLAGRAWLAVLVSAGILAAGAILLLAWNSPLTHTTDGRGTTDRAVELPAASVRAVPGPAEIARDAIAALTDDTRAALERVVARTRASATTTTTGAGGGTTAGGDTSGRVTTSGSTGSTTTTVTGPGGTGVTVTLPTVTTGGTSTGGGSTTGGETTAGATVTVPSVGTVAAGVSSNPNGAVGATVSSTGSSTSVGVGVGPVGSVGVSLPIVLPVLGGGSTP